MKFFAATLLAISAAAMQLKQDGTEGPPPMDGGYGSTGYGATGYGADSYGAGSYGADMYGADMYGADSYGADGYGADFYGGYGYGGYDHDHYGHYGGYGDYGHYYGGDDFPFPPPECGEGPTEEEFDNATDEQIFGHVDQNENGAVDAKEGFEALYCMVEWGFMEEEEAIFMYHFLGEHANLDENGIPDELDFSEAQHAMETLEHLHETNEHRHEDGHEEFPMPPSDCGDKPEGVENWTPEEIFGAIDQNQDGGVDAEEGYMALYCMVEWQMLTEDQAFAAFDHIGSYAGDDDVVDFEEMTAAVEAMQAMTEEEIAAAVEGASTA